MNSSAEVYFSYNERLINKNNRKDTDAFANGWVPVTGTVDLLLDVIKSGMAYSVWFKDGVRKTENFVGSNLVSIDVDGNNRIDDAIAQEFQSIVEHYVAQNYAEGGKLRSQSKTIPIQSI